MRAGGFSCLKGATIYGGSDALLDSHLNPRALFLPDAIMTTDELRKRAASEPWPIGFHRPANMNEPWPIGAMLRDRSDDLGYEFDEIVVVVSRDKTTGEYETVRRSEGSFYRNHWTSNRRHWVSMPASRLPGNWTRIA